MADQTRWRLGAAEVPTHHGEILQGVFADGGRLRRGLVTLPCSLHVTTGTFQPRPGGGITVSPEWKIKARRAAELAIGALGLPTAAGGHLELASEVPVSRGFGSSTSDVLAAIWSVRNAFCATVPARTVARLAVQAETASDSLMFEDSAVLFAQREGEVIEDFGYPLPPVSVLGFGARPGGAGVDTLSLPPARYTAREIRVFGELWLMMREAILTKDVALLGAVATASTEINQRNLPIPQLAGIRSVAAAAGAVGIQTAHSGDISGLLFDRDDPDRDERMDLAGRLLGGIGISEQWKFTVGE
jgi:uncharacterized protein involved in propanediol utilization